MKKKSSFLRALLIYCLVLAIIIGAGLFVLNRFLVSYEASRPDKAVESFMTEKDRSFWLSGLQELVDRGFNEFTKNGAALSEFGIDESADISWRSGSGDDQKKEYEVRLGSSKICTISLVPDEKLSFGLTSWKISGWEFRMPGGSDIRISVPTGCTAEINGVEVGSEYISGLGNMDLSLEHSFDIAPASDIYEIKGMMGPADIKAYDPLGNELAAQSVSANEVAFFPEALYSFDFCALSSAEVYINGEEISGEYCSPIDFGFDVETGVEVLHYECTDLYTTPDIRVADGSEVISPTIMDIGSAYIPGAGNNIDGKIADFLEGFTYAYVDFSANKNHAADANFAVLAGYLLPGSELYTLTANTIENIAWATTSDLNYNSIDFYDLIPLGNGKYICSIFYDISYVLGGRDLDVKSGNLILIEQQGSRYYVSAMSALD